jgi:protein arginine phosphatase
MKNFLFICTGNTCRSPMAEAILKHVSDDKLNVQSAGLFAVPGSPANEKAIQVLQNKSIPISHQSQAISKSLLEWADIVLTMTMEHKQVINQRYSSFAEKVYTLKEYVSLIEGKNEIWDEIKRLYSEIETKRLQFLGKQSGKMATFEENKKREEAFYKAIEPEYKKLQELELQLPSMDISDPYGSSVDTYQQTLDELYELLHKINSHIEKK